MGFDLICINTDGSICDTGEVFIYFLFVTFLLSCKRLMERRRRVYRKGLREGLQNKTKPNALKKAQNREGKTKRTAGFDFIVSDNEAKTSFMGCMVPSSNKGANLVELTCIIDALQWAVVGCYYRVILLIF